MEYEASDLNLFMFTNWFVFGMVFFDERVRTSCFRQDSF